MGTRIPKISKYKPSIFQGRFDFAPVAAMSFTAEHSIERLAFKVVAGTLIGLGCLYLYFVTASVLHVMERREALAKVHAIQSTIGSLEQRYFELSQGLSPKDGGKLGLSPVSQTSYVSRPGVIGAVTIARNEI